MKKRSFPIVVLFLFAASGLAAQEKVDVKEQQAVVDSLARLIEENYVFPDIARQIAANMRQKQAAGQYRGLVDVAAFADALTKDLRAFNNDKHLSVNFNPEFSQELRRPRSGEDDAPEGYLLSLRRSNYGFKEIKILEGNVGYLDLRQFSSPAQAGQAATSAMNFLSGADAIIFDLRYNGGGDPGMIQLLTSYLYNDGQLIHLNNFYNRSENDTTQTWTLPYVPGKRNPKSKVYVLTSDGTFSAAEEFTYNLKNLKRATIVGETTGGGAHPGSVHPVAARFVSFIPDGRAINPITGTNWEGTGVEPDVKVPADMAFDKAYFLALEELSKNAGSDEAARGYYDWYKVALKAKVEPVKIDAARLMAYAGVYGERTLSFENGKLYYQRTGRPKFELQALTADTFAPAGMSDFRVSLEMSNGKVVALIAQYQDGRRERNPRSEVKP